MEDHEVIEPLAKDLWETYSRAVGGKAVNGDSLPEWEELRGAKPDIAEAWRTVARRVAAIAEAGLS